MSDPKEGSYKVSDRRKFNADGTPRENEISDESPPPESVTQVEPQPAGTGGGSGNVVSFPGETGKKRNAESLGGDDSSTKDALRSKTAAGDAERAYEDASRARGSRLPQASFLSLANMLGVEAAMHLGLIQSTAGEETPVDIEAARHMIDLLGVLHEKTRGNLTAEEDSLLDNMLADLRMQFVAASRGR